MKKMAVYCVVTPCSLTAVYRRFTHDCCLLQQGDDLMAEAASTRETSVIFYQTARRCNPEDSHLHTRRRENLRSQVTEVNISIFLKLQALLTQFLNN
jgi:hypothetical protein